MNKVLSFTLASLALAALASPAHAKFGGSVRGDVGILGNQLPFFMAQEGFAPDTPVDTVTRLSHRKEGQWDFTGRIFVYTSCMPCPTYIAASWQGSNHKAHSCHSAVENLTVDATNLEVIIPLRIIDPGFRSQINGIVEDIESDNPVSSRIEVKNKFSKAKLGIGFDFIKTCCFNFTMEVGGNYLDTHLNAYKTYTVTQIAANGETCLSVPPRGNLICSPGVAELPYDFVIHDTTRQKTEGVGLYASFRADYKFPATCLGNCFGIYGKAEVADIIGRQKYSGTVCYVDAFTDSPSPVPITPPEVFNYDEHVCNRYNNVVEFDLEAALTYSPCFKCWNNLNLNIALGVRADSFVNLFSKPIEYMDVTYLSLTRPTVFLEVGIKV